jgi:flavin-binding protein dodecin
MAKGDNAVYRVTEVIGTSSNSWEDAAKNAVKTASKSLRDLRIAEITKLDVRIEDGKITQFRARLALSFKYDA